MVKELGPVALKPEVAAELAADDDGSGGGGGGRKLGHKGHHHVVRVRDSVEGWTYDQV